MKPPLFRYQAPRTLEEAVVALASDPDAMVLAGGQSLLPAMNFRLATPVAAGRHPTCRRAERDRHRGEQIIVKAMTRHRELELDERVRAANPLIDEAMAHVAHIPIRNRGTVVGSLCHADACGGDAAVVLVLLGGSVLVARPGGPPRDCGRRILPIST